MTEVELPDGTRLAVSITGTGPPLVLCHGGPGLWDDLGSLAALVDDSVQVVRYDQRGCGRSTGSDGPFTVAQFVDDLDQLRQALGHDRWWVGGHSWGAQLALAYGLAHPESTEGVLYVSGTGLGDGYREPYRVERARRLGPDLQRWQELSERERTPAEEEEWCVLQWSTDHSPSSDGRALAQAEWDGRDDGVSVNHRCNRELWADNLAQSSSVLERLPSMHPPLLVLHGADDTRPVRVTDPLVAAARDARRTVVADAGHSPWLEQPQAVRLALLEGILE